jgi:superfamily II DNA or RNA helicase
MHGRVDSVITLPRWQVPPRALEQLVRALSVPNPAARGYRRQRFHTEPERLYFTEEDATTLTIPRGAVDDVRCVLAQHGVRIDFEDQRVLPTERLDNLAMPLLRGYQREAVDRFVRATQGVLVLPTGAGKTRCVLGVIATLATPTLILLQSTDLATQWKTELATLLGIEAGVVGDGDVDIRPVTIGLVQALARWPVADLDSFLGRFGLLVAEEGHHVAAPQVRSIVHRCPAKYRLGVTATPEREDGLGPVVRFFLGPELVRVAHDDLVEQGVLVRPSVQTLETAFEFPYAGPEDYPEFLTALALDVPRAQQIARAIATEVAAGHACLALAGRRDYCVVLARQLAELGVASEVLTSEVTRPRRARVLARARQGEVPVLIATQLLDEGVDVPRLSRVFLAWPSKARGRTIQRVGRVMRPHPAKPDAFVIDVVDRRVAPLARQAARRAALYRQVFGATPRPLRAPGA